MTEPTQNKVLYRADVTNEIHLCKRSNSLINYRWKQRAKSRKLAWFPHYVLYALLSEICENQFLYKTKKISLVGKFINCISIKLIDLTQHIFSMFVYECWFSFIPLSKLNRFPKENNWLWKRRNMLTVLFLFLTVIVLFFITFQHFSLQSVKQLDLGHWDSLCRFPKICYLYF